MIIYKCPICGRIVEELEIGAGKPVCCGRPMTQLQPGTVDASREKHVPVFTIQGDKCLVNIGSTPHPMTREHYILWIAIETTLGTQRHDLDPKMEPHTVFHLSPDEEVLAVYAYCNLHGLWKAV